MKTSLSVIFILLLAPARVPAAQQTPAGGVEHFSKDGLSFDYPSGWTLEDQSRSKQQHLVLRSSGSITLVMVVAEREPLRYVGQLYPSLVMTTKPYVERLAQQLGAKATTAPDASCLSIGESLTFRYHLSGRIAQTPSTGEVFAFVKGQRLVHLIYIRQDKDEAAGAAALKSVADTLKVELPAKPSPDAEKMEQVGVWGVLNRKLTEKPEPVPPPAAKRAGAQGLVVVLITADEQGNVTSAQAISGHFMLHEACEKAARRAKLSPTVHCGKAVKVTGFIYYLFRT